MLSSIFQSSTLPVLEQVVNFTEARHGVLAGNIANLDTPGYKTRDLSPALFQERLKEAIETRHQPATPTYDSRSFGHDIGRATPQQHETKQLAAFQQSGRLDEKHPASRRRRREHGTAGQRDREEPTATQPGDQHHERAVPAADERRLRNEWRR